jgi:hypothetical protein
VRISYENLLVASVGMPSNVGGPLRARLREKERKRGNEERKKRDESTNRMRSEKEFGAKSIGCEI